MPTSSDDQALTIVRTFEAPVERIWRAWTEPEEVKKWWGPKAFSAPFVTIDFRVGGKYLFCMRGSPAPGAPTQDFWSTGTYRSIVPKRKIVATDSFADANGNVVPSTHYGMDGFPLELVVTLTFRKLPGGKTAMTLQHAGLPAGQLRESTQTGWNESFDRLAASLAA